MNNAQNINNGTRKLQMLGYGLLNLNNNSGGNFKTLLQKGMGIPLTQNLIELYKKEIINKRQGTSIVPLDDFTIHLHYFEIQNHDILVLIYMMEKESDINFSELYFLSKRINKKFKLNEKLQEIIADFESAIEIPRSEGIIAIFIIGAAGSPFISKINKARSNIADHEVHIGGFISALLSFSDTIIGEETGAKLKEINFGNQKFFVISKNNVIFAFLVDSMNFLLHRYMYLIADEFLYQYKEYIQDFNGDVTPFSDFERIIDQYLII